MKTYAEKPIGPWMDPISDDKFQLVQDWDYIWKQGDHLQKQHFKAGIIIDMASVPNLAGWIVDLHPNGPLGPASLPHDIDYIYQGGKYKFPDGMFQRWNGERWINLVARHSKRGADKRFKRILEEGGELSGTKIGIAYQVVSVGGWPGWWSNDAVDRVHINKLYEV